MHDDDILARNSWPSQLLINSLEEGHIQLTLLADKLNVIKINSLHSTLDAEAFCMLALIAELAAEEISTVLADSANIVVSFIDW